MNAEGAKAAEKRFNTEVTEDTKGGVGSEGKGSVAAARGEQREREK